MPRRHCFGGGGLEICSRFVNSRESEQRLGCTSSEIDNTEEL